MIPLPTRGDLELGGRTAQLEDQFCEVPNRRLGAAREVVDVARLAALRSGHETALHILDVDEVARSHASVVEL